MIDVDEGHVWLPVGDEPPALGLVRAVARLVIAVTQRHRDEVREGLADDEEDARSLGVAIAVRSGALELAVAVGAGAREVAVAVGT